MRSSFREFENYLRTFSPLSENDIQLSSRQYISRFITYKNLAGAYTFEELSEILSRGF